MIRMALPRRALAALLLAVPLACAAQKPPGPAALVEAQREAMAPLAFMDGTWRGTAWSLLPSGEKHTVTQTERIGPFLGGTVKVIEGRGYDRDGRVSFNALGIVSFDPGKRAYSMRSYALGRAGDFPLVPTADGYAWEIPQGPATIRYAATIRDGRWVETGHRIVAGREPAQFFEMTLERIGDTDWPAGGAVPMK